jgi:trigger factor
VAVPTVNGIQYDLGKPLKFEVQVECSPEVPLKDYKGLPVEKKPVDVPEDEVSKRLEEMREANAKLVPSADEKVGEKHFAVVDYIGTLDGLPIEGGKAEGQIIDMSAPQALAGFTEGVKGAKVGETREVPVLFPAEHPKKELAGKQVVFRVTVTQIKDKQVPALDDEFAKDVGTNDLADLKDRLRKSMEHERSRAERQRLEKEVSDRLLEAHAFDVPPSMVEERARHLTANLKQYLSRQGASEEDWKANEAKMLERNRAEAERSIRLSYLLTAIADKEKIEVSDAEVDELLRKSVESVEPARRKEMEKWMSGRRDEVRAQLKEEKIFTLLIEGAKATA